MRITRLTSIGPPWDWDVAEKISTKLTCWVDRYHLRPYELIVHKECTVRDLDDVVPKDFAYVLLVEDIPDVRKTPTV